jgi:hypothetical protein
MYVGIVDLCTGTVKVKMLTQQLRNDTGTGKPMIMCHEYARVWVRV